MVKEIFNEIVMADLFMTLSEDNRAKLTPPVDCKPTTCYKSVICLTAVSIIVQEIFDETVMIDLFLPYPVMEQN